jgi:N-acyl-D-aspartate/D-glutamate deacylase
VYDLVIRGGSVVDGTGGVVFEGDVAVEGGVIREVGKVADRGREEIDARGRIVTPGFVDIHTHYDGQATWDRRLAPSSMHGVTTVLMGNCGVGFAPCRPRDRDRLIRLMEGVEDIPGAVLAEGLGWNWETFPEFLTALEGLPHDIDFATQLPHGPLRVYVMGERGADGEPATGDDIARMAAITKEAVLSGALGFSTSRTLNHRTSDGHATPSLTAGEAELLGIAMAMKEVGQGVLQYVSDFNDTAGEFGLMQRISTLSGRPLSFSLAQSDRRPDGWMMMLEWIAKARREGAQIRGQVCGRPVSVLLGLQLTLNPFSECASYKAIADLPLAGRVARLRQPERRAQLLSESAASQNPFLASVLAQLGRAFLLGDPPNYEPLPEQMLGAQAQARGVDVRELALDLMLGDEGRGILCFPFMNYAQCSLDPSLAMMRDEGTVLGLGDGGAHVGIICDGSFPTTMLSFWTRDRTRGEKLPLQWVVRAQTHDTAAAVGLGDRGLIASGYKADLNVIDLAHLRLHAPEVAYDLPAGGRRLIQRADGYDATIVSGEVIYREGQPTGAMPGRLVRGQRGAG